MRRRALAKGCLIGAAFLVGARLVASGLLPAPAKAAAMMALPLLLLRVLGRQYRRLDRGRGSGGARGGRRGLGPALGLLLFRRGG